MKLLTAQVFAVLLIILDFSEVRGQEPDCGVNATLCGPEKCLKDSTTSLVNCVDGQCTVNTSIPLFEIVGDPIDVVVNRSCIDPVNACGTTFCAGGEICNSRVAGECKEETTLFQCGILGQYCDIATEACLISELPFACINIAEQCNSYASDEAACMDFSKRFTFAEDDGSVDAMGARARSLCGVDCSRCPGLNDPTPAPTPSAAASFCSVGGAVSILLAAVSATNMLS